MLRFALLSLAVVLPHASPTLGDAKVFEPFNISTSANDFGPTFSPDGTTMLFSRGAKGRSFIFEAKWTGHHWGVPRVVGFSGVAVDLEPSWSPDGRYVVFASNRSLGKIGLTTHYFGKVQIGGNLWRVDVRDGHWGQPQHLAKAINNGNSVWRPAIANHRVVYFMSTDSVSGRFRLHRASHVGSKSPVVTDLTFSTGASNDVDPYVTPDEHILIFSSDRGRPGHGSLPGPERLFIAFDPLSKSPVVCPIHVRGWDNANVSMVEASLSNDRRTLYFTSRVLAHGAGEAPKGEWDNGKSNIWTTPFSAHLWAFPGASSVCTSEQNHVR